MNFMIVALFVFAFLGIAFLMARFGGGTPGGTDSTSFPYDSSTIPPPVWSADSGNANDDAQCTVDDGGWSDGGSCDSGDLDGSSSGD